jgi:hypothetical protein
LTAIHITADPTPVSHSFARCNPQSIERSREENPAMAARDPDVRERVCRAAAAQRWGLPEAPILRQQLAVDRLVGEIKRVSHADPPLPNSAWLKLANALIGGTSE